MQQKNRRISILLKCLFNKYFEKNQNHQSVLHALFYWDSLELSTCWKYWKKLCQLNISLNSLQKMHGQ